MSSGNFLFKYMSKGVVVDPKITTVNKIKLIVVVMMSELYSE
jgi:hypothetical protein